MSSKKSFNEHFTLANIPFGVASRASGDESQVRPQTATRLHDRVYFLTELLDHGLLKGLDSKIVTAIQEPLLNDLASLGRPSHRKLREALQDVLSSSMDGLESCSALANEVTMHMPLRIGDFTDFSLSKDHVLNAGEAATGSRSLPPGFLHFPVGYSGRCSSIVPSGTKIRRPLGQYRAGEGVEFGASKAMDFELEVGCVVGKSSNFGEPVRIDDASEHIFGFLLLNDWSCKYLVSSP